MFTDHQLHLHLQHLADAHMYGGSVNAAQYSFNTKVHALSQSDHRRDYLMVSVFGLKCGGVITFVFVQLDITEHAEGSSWVQSPNPTIGVDRRLLNAAHPH